MFSARPLVAVFSATCCAATPADAVPFKTIDRGGQGEIENAREVVVRTAAEWTALWKQHAPGRKPPAVDFTRSMVVGVFLGSRATGGYAVDITGLERTGPELVVTYREAQPVPTDIVTQVLTSPYHLVTTGRFAGPVRFVRAK